MDFSMFVIFLFPWVLGSLLFFFFFNQLRISEIISFFFSYLQPHFFHSEDLEDVPI